MRISKEISGLINRFSNYSQEKTSILEKLKSPMISEERRSRLQVRLKDLDERLIPQTARKIR